MWLVYDSYYLKYSDYIIHCFGFYSVIAYILLQKKEHIDIVNAIRRTYLVKTT